MRRVALIAASRDGLILFGKRQDNGRWTLPGGHLEDGESWEAGARRELLEETGLKPVGEMKQLRAKMVSPSFEIRIFACEVEGAPNGKHDPDQECAVWAFFDAENGIPKSVAENMAGPKDMKENIAAQELGIAKAEDLEKMQRLGGMPGLGIDDRRETPYIDTQEDYRLRHAQIKRFVKPYIRVHPGLTDPAEREFWASMGAGEEADRTFRHANGAVYAAPGVPDRPSFALTGKARAGLGHDPGGNNSDISTKLHEDFHHMMARVQAKYGPQPRAHLARNLWESIPVPIRVLASQFTHTRNRGVLGQDHEHEEHLAIMHNFLNDPDERKKFFQYVGLQHDEQGRRRIEGAVKQAMRHLNQTMTQVDESWLVPNRAARHARSKLVPPPESKRPTPPPPAQPVPKPKAPKAMAPKPKDPNQLELFKCQRAPWDKGVAADWKLGKEEDHRFKGLDVSEPMQGPMPAETEGTRFSHLEVDGAPSADAKETPKPEGPKLPKYDPFRVGEGKVYDHGHHLPKHLRDAGWSLTVHQHNQANMYPPDVTLSGPMGQRVSQKLARDGKAGHVFEAYGSTGANIPEGADEAMTNALSQHLDLREAGRLQEIEDEFSNQVKRINNRFADTKTTESSGRFFGSNRKMSERKAFDYSYLLDDDQRAAGYGLTIYHHPQHPNHPIIEMHQGGKTVGVDASNPMGDDNPHDRMDMITSDVESTRSHKYRKWRWPMAQARIAHQINVKKKVKDAQLHSLSEKDFLDTLPLPTDESTRFKQLEVDKGRKRKPKPEPQDTTPGRGSFLEVGDPVKTERPKAPMLQTESPHQNVFDYTPILPESLRNMGYTALIHDSKQFPGTLPTVTVRLNGETVGRGYSDGFGGHSNIKNRERNRQQVALHTDLARTLWRRHKEDYDPHYQRAMSQEAIPLAQEQWQDALVPRAHHREESQLGQNHRNAQAYDYSHVLPDDLKGYGKLLVIHQPQYDNQMYAIMTDPSMLNVNGGLHAYPTSAAYPGTAYNEPGGGFRPHMINALMRHAEHIKRGQMPQAKQAQPSRFNLLELSERGLSKSHLLPQPLMAYKPKAPIEPTLVGVHNLPASELIRAHDNGGGLHYPTVKVVDKQHPVSGEADVTLVAHPSLFDPMREPVFDGETRFRNLDDLLLRRHKLTPRESFEVRPERVVALNEFKGAAVPTGSGPDLLDVLKRNKIDHVEFYEPGDIDSHGAAIRRIAQEHNLAKGEGSSPRGFVSPTGDWHPVSDDLDHHDWIGMKMHDNVESGDAAYQEAMKLGWMGVGIGGYHNVQGHADHLMNAHHPATKKVREIAASHWGPEFEAYMHSDKGHQSKMYDTAAFARGGHFREPNPHVLFKTETNEVDRLLNHPNPIERRLALKLHGIHENHLMHAMADEDPEIVRQAMDHPSFGPRALLALMQLPNRDQLQLMALQHDLVDREHLASLYHTHKDRSPAEIKDIVHAISHHPALDADLIERMVANGHGDALIENENTPPAVIAKIIDDHLADPAHPEKRARARRALKHPKAQPYQVAQAFKDGAADIKIAIAQGPNMPEAVAQDHLQRGLLPSGDHEAFLRSVIVSNKKATPKHLETAAKDRNPLVRHMAMEKLGRGPKLQPIKKAEGHNLEAEHHEVVGSMSGHHQDYMDALEAARFLNGGKEVAPEAARAALWEADGDVEEAALIAYSMGLSESSLKALRGTRALMRQPAQEEPEPAVAQKVEPGDESARQASQEVQDAFQDKFVMPVALGGKHSKGMLLARDQRSGNTWLLKPGSGGQTPAAGAQEESASQSRREAAFYHVADAWHLGDIMPEAQLLVIDGKEYAAMRLLPWDYKNLDKLKQKDVGAAREVLSKYLRTGALHRWGALDYVLGNPDRHAANLMVKDGDLRLIDHGSAMAGPSFSPATDRYSFTPYYLRAWAPGRWSQMEASDRLRYMPRLGRETEADLKEWLLGLDENVLERILSRYGVDPEPAKARLAQLKARAAAEPADLAVNKAWVET